MTLPTSSSTCRQARWVDLRSSAVVGIRFPLLAKKMVAVGFLRKGLYDLSGLVKGGDS